LFLAAALAVLFGAGAAAQEASAPSAPPLAAGIKVTRDRDLVTVDNFPSKALGNLRALRILLPAGYDGSGEVYTVLYMHDGQNLFSEKTAAHGMEWEADETAGRLAREKKTRPFIVVGIDNTPARVNEYTQTRDEKSGEGGAAEQYARYLESEVVPYVDGLYRTIPRREGRAVMGSSLGGLVSLYILATRPQTFSMAGVMSPSLWWGQRSIFSLVERSTIPADVKIWLDMGLRESSEETVPDAIDMERLLLARGLRYGENLLFMLDGPAVHNEASWARRLHNPLQWFFGPAAGEVVEARGVVSAAKLALNGEPASARFWGRLRFSSGISCDYIPDSIDVSPPLLHWKDAKLGIVSGAEPGAVKLTGRFGNRPFSAAVSIVKYLSPWTDLALTVTLPPGTPAGAEIYISGSQEELGSWDPGKIKLSPVPGKPFERIFRARFKRGAAASFKFTRGSWETVEKNSDGGEIADHTLVFEETAMTARVSVARWADAAAAK